MTPPPYPHLLSPLAIGKHTIRNRVWMAAHATLLVKDNLFTDAHVHYYVERARGGVGIITMEAMAVHPTTQPYKGKAFAFDPRMVPQYRKIADAVHAHGAKILAQPWHRGRETNSVASGEPVWAPSSVPCSVYREMPHVMTAADIGAIIEGYRLSARYAREGGLDGIEVHGMSHGYLLNQFLSPATNHRTDEFGGSVENRLRIVREILDATRAEAGPELMVGVRINGDDGHEGGLGPDEWADIARRLEATGHIDYVSVSQGTYLNRMLIYPTAPEIHGYQMAATRKIKQAVKLPVVGVGRIVEPEEAEKFLAAGDCDFVALARALVADPEWVAKAARGDARRIRPCVGANWCMSSIFAQAPLACIHNPAAGAEIELGTGTLKPAEKRKRVAVVGGGPAGMRAAATLAERGHAVTLFERRGQLGGQVRFWAKAPSRRELLGIVEFLSARLAEQNVEIRLNTAATPADLDGYESVLIATGASGLKHGWTPLHPARWAGPPMQGTGQDNVFSYLEYLEREPQLGRNVIVADGLGGRQGAVVAEVLATRGHAVEFVTQLAQGSPDLAGSRDWGKVHGMLRRLGVRFTVDSEIVAIDGETVTLRDVYTRDTVLRENVAAVVFMLGAAAEDALFHALAPRRASGLDLRLIGDALAPRRVDAAIREGELAARAI
ncbi:MAG: FAD-dependent oxidoreductase [Alphaproteobacteria bacterium]|nr:FAD-dependent oxidoreductase [Alphaproteobacteria bacterium]